MLHLVFERADYKKSVPRLYPDFARMNALGKSVMIAIDTIQNRILFIRGQRVMMDYDLADLYEVRRKP